MKFQQYDLGHQQGGNVVEVTFSGSAVNARLMDSSNLHNYKYERSHRYYGGLLTRSPAHIPIPHAGSWYVTVDMQGLRGHARFSVRVIPKETMSPLPEYSPPPISALVRPIGRGNPDVPITDDSMQANNYDVFISHANEDKEDVVRPLAISLVSHGLKVWYDEFELRIGDNIRRKIDIGLAQSRFGVVVISPSFLGKNWPQYELDGLITREMTGEQEILPLWHKISKQEVLNYSPSFAGKLARSTSDFTVEEIAREIADVILSNTP